MNAAERNKEIANIIAKQIGGMAFMMMGTNQKIIEENGVRFNVKGTRKCNWIEVTLEPTDTYKVTFWKYSPSKYTMTKISTESMVYVDFLHSTIEDFTGLYLSL